MLELEEAQNRIFATLTTLPDEKIPLQHAEGRILAAAVHSKISLPRFDNSAVDGYAVHAEDLHSASPSSPVGLSLIGQVAAGDQFQGTVQRGQCLRIFTGSPLPSGANAIAMQEDTQVDSRQAGQILFLDTVKPWENVRFEGEDVKLNATLADSGARLNVAQISLLGAAGVESVLVKRQPVVGLLATGNELREPGQTLAPGEIYESNRLTLASLCRRIGAVPKIFPLVPDTFAATQNALAHAFAECDVVVTTGGVSVGELDFVKAAFEELGGQLEFWKVSLKPGKPFVFGRLREKYLFGLPGNPVSAFVTFVVLAAPALARMQGATKFSWPMHPAVLAEPLSNRGDRRHFVRVTVDQKGNVRSSGTQASHILSSLSHANGLVEIPPNTTLDAGETVFVLRWD